MVPGDDEDEGGGNGGPIIDPNRSVELDERRAQKLCDQITLALHLTDQPGGQDGYAAIAAQRLEEALMWARKHRDTFL